MDWGVVERSARRDRETGCHLARQSSDCTARPCQEVIEKGWSALCTVGNWLEVPLAAVAARQEPEVSIYGAFSMRRQPWSTLRSALFIVK